MSDAKIAAARRRMVNALDRQSRALSMSEFAADQRAYDSALADLVAMGCDANAEHARADRAATAMEGREI